MTEGRKRTYQSWYAMVRRCQVSYRRQYQAYGARGIRVCAHWLKFERFLIDMGERPAGFVLDRVDNLLGYGPANCRWVDRRESCINRHTFKTNTSGVVGVSRNLCRKNGKEYIYWTALAFPGRKKTLRLYHGRDFAEACHIRWEWEKANGYAKT
jgi:hypothetical protein